MILSNFPASGAEKINNAQVVDVLAEDKIQIGDAVYSIENDWTIHDGVQSCGQIKKDVTFSLFSPDGSILVLGGEFSGYAKAYSVSGTTITYISDIYANAGTTALNGYVYTAAFSPDGSILVLGGGFWPCCAKAYSVSDKTITYIGDIYSDSESNFLQGSVKALSFSQDGTTLVLGGSFSGYAKVYSVSGTTITYVSDIYADSGTTSLGAEINLLSLSPDGSTLVLGGNFTGRAKAYSISGLTVLYIGDFYSDSSGAYLNSVVRVVSFSPDCKTVIVGGQFSGGAKVYSVSETAITYVSDIYANTGTTALRNVYCVEFSLDGTTLVLGGGFSGYAKVYSVSGTTINYVSDIYADSGTQRLPYSVDVMSLSASGKYLLICGGYSYDSRYAKLYSVYDNTFSYIGDLSDGKSSRRYTGNILFSSFSPDESIIILCGKFTDRAKYFHITEDGVSYIDDIYADKRCDMSIKKTLMSSSFSPSGDVLVLAGNDGNFSSYGNGYVKVYSVTSSGIFYSFDLISYGSGESLLFEVDNIAFSPSGELLVLSSRSLLKIYTISNGEFSYVGEVTKPVRSSYYDGPLLFSPDGAMLVCSYCIFSVSGSSVEFLDYIRDENGDIIENSMPKPSYAFSPDGSIFVFSGGIDSTGFIKQYTVSGQSISYVCDVVSGSYKYANSMIFTPSGDMLVTSGGYGDALCQYYSVSNGSISFLGDLEKQVSNYALLAITPDGKTLIQCKDGSSSGYTSIYLYSILEQNVEYIKEVKISEEMMSYDYNAYSVSISPCGRFLILVGEYYVSGVFYRLLDNGTYSDPFCGSSAYLATNGVFPAENANSEVGFSKSNMNAGDIGKVKLIGSIDDYAIQVDTLLDTLNGEVI